MNEYVRTAAESAAYNEWRAQAAKRAAEYERMQRAERDRRTADRAAAKPVPLTLETLVTVIADRVAPELSLGPSRRHEYAEHLVQSYCECASEPEWPSGDPGGWVLCAHAKDEGF